MLDPETNTPMLEGNLNFDATTFVLSGIFFNWGYGQVSILMELSDDQTVPGTENYYDLTLRFTNEANLSIEGS